LVAAALLVPLVPIERVLAVDCSDVHIVWARGATMGPDQFDFQNFVQRDLEESRILTPATYSD
jgi:hypothetical protein